jgi:hypothetical protein
LRYYRGVIKGGNTMLQYKVVELSNVTEESIEETLNEWTAKGWQYDGLQFAMRESSKRPAMAFVVFTREEKNDQ